MPTRDWEVFIPSAQFEPLKSDKRMHDLRGTLRNDQAYKSYWANELHPNARGFSMITAKFESLISRL